MNSMKNALCVSMLFCGMVIVDDAVASEWYGADANGTAKEGNWSSDGQPGWNGTGIPNAQGAVAYFASMKKNNVVQDIAAGVTIGSLILDLPANAANLDLSLKGPTSATSITLDQDGTDPGYAVISNNAARSRLSCGTSVKFVLNDDLLIVNTTPDTYNRTFSVSLTSTITGNGNVTIDNSLDLPNNGVIVLSNGSSTFTGSVLIRRGCAKAQNAKAFGATTNPVTLGAEGYGDATLMFEGTSMAFSNPITVSKVAGARMRIYGECISSVTKSATYAVTLSGAITLNGDVTFDIPAYAFNNGTVVCPQTETVKSVISGVGALLKENDGTLVLQKANDYAGGTTLKAGTLSLASGATLGTGALDVYDGATLALAGDVTVDSLSLNGKLQKRGVYAAADSAETGVAKVAWLTGSGRLIATNGKTSGLAVSIH